jgi:hypothetical protein
MIAPNPLTTPTRPVLTSAESLPRIEAAFRAVEDVLANLGIDNPSTLRSPQLVEEALEGIPALDGTLVVLDPSELRAAELDLEETVADERAGGSLFVSLPNLGELSSRRVRYRDLAAAAAGYAFVDPGAHVLGFGRFHFAPRPRFLRRWRVIVADTPGFRVAVIARPLPQGGFIGLWSGNPDIVDEIGRLLRSVARSAGHDVPAPAAPVPALLGITEEKDVWRQAAVLRGQREVRENELREIARQAALRGVELRRQRAAALAAAAKAPAA